MPVITVSRQTGSGGAEIGRAIAERLGANYLNTQIIHEVARRLDISEAAAAEHNERAEDYVERLARVFSLAEPALAPVGWPSPALAFESTTQAFVSVTRQLVTEAARAGQVVIFGHGAQFILAGQAGVFHVRFVAPLEARLERVMRREGVGRSEAERHIREEDQRRASHIRQFYNADWHSPEPFHLILNTALLGKERCLRLVLHAVAEHERQAPAER
jgi:cytidylate kinase